MKHLNIIKVLILCLLSASSYSIESKKLQITINEEEYRGVENLSKAVILSLAKKVEKELRQNNLDPTGKNLRDFQFNFLEKNIRFGTLKLLSRYAQSELIAKERETIKFLIC